MAGGQERILRRRIRSVQSTKKITRAMELIAATRVTSAQQRAAAARPYAEQITSVIAHLASAGASLDHPLLRPAVQPRTIAYVVIASDRGLAGAYNTSVIRAAEREILDRRADGIDYRLFLVGKKPQGYFAFRNYRIHAAYSGISDTPDYESARRVADDVAAAFLSGEVDQVQLVYTRFLSVGVQRVTVRRFMPLEASGIEAVAHEGPPADYEFEPEPAAILERLLPRYVEARLFAALLEASASEHAARQRAMKSATDNAEELITKLTRVMNRARQDAITTEIMEIVGGAEALSQGESGSEDILVDRIGGIRDLFPDSIDRSAAS
jgi:F-type H+-transporting ATPase subunit gamma